MLKMIKSIAFDCGNVLFSNAWNDEGTDPCFDIIPKILGINKQKGNEIFFKHWSEIRIGKKNESILFKDLIANSRRKISLKKLRRFYYNCITKRDTFEIVERLHKKYPNLPLYTLNDEGKEWMDIRIKKFKLRKYFKDFITSGYVGYSKKEGKKIYEILLKRSGLKAGDFLFIDDRRMRLLTAKEIGFKTILFKNKRQLRKDLKKHGIKL